MLRAVIAPVKEHRRRTAVRVLVGVSLSLLTIFTVTRVAFDVSVNNLQAQLNFDQGIGCYDEVSPETFGRYLDELRWDPVQDTTAGLALGSIADFMSVSLVDTDEANALLRQQQTLFESCSLLDDVRTMHKEAGLLQDDPVRTRRVVITLAKMGPRAM